MSNAVHELEKIYKDLIEKELKEICDEVIERGTFRYFGCSGIYIENFLNAGYEYIDIHNLPVDPGIINECLVNKIKKEEIIDLKNNKYLAKNNIYKKFLFDKAAAYVRSQNEVRTYTIRCLRSFLNFLTIRVPSVFDEFEKLKRLLNDLGISLSSQLTIFIEAIETNYTCVSQGPFYVFKPDYEDMLKHKFKYITKEQITDIVKNHKIEGFLKEDNPELEQAQDELREYMQDSCVDVTALQNNCIKLVEAIHKDPRTEEDNKTIIECMGNLYFSDLTYRMFKYLDRQKGKNNNQASTQESDKQKNAKNTPKAEENNKKSVNSLPSEEPKKQTNLNQTIREISKYFDLDSLELKESLSLDQIIYVLSLMYSIDIKESVIESFLRSTMREYKQMHPYAIYNHIYDKFVYLAEYNPKVREHLDMIEYILSDVNIFMCDNELYESTKKLVEEEIKGLMRIINGDYTYEKNEAKKLLNTNEEQG